MTVIARWDPFREFTKLQDRMNRLFRDLLGSDGRDEALTRPALLRQQTSTRTSTQELGRKLTAVRRFPS